MGYKLEEFQYEIVYRSGKLHQDADSLSRNPVNPHTQEDDDAKEFPLFTMSPEEISKLQQADEQLKTIYLLLKNTGGTSSEKQAKGYILIDEVIYRRNTSGTGRIDLICIPKALQTEILWENHDDPLGGHLGFTKTYNKIKSRYYWVGMLKIIENYVRTCPDCQGRKQPKMLPAGLLQSIPIGEPWDRVGIDLLGPFPRSKTGNNTIVVATDYATRMVITKAMPNGTAPEVARFILEDIICKFGSPRELLSDQGKVFLGKVVTGVLKHLGVRPLLTTCYHPQTNGLTERFNGTLADMLSLFCSSVQDDWDEVLPHLTFSHNASRQETTGFSPYYLMYGREPRLPTEAMLYQKAEEQSVQEIMDKLIRAREVAKARTVAQQRRSALRYNEKHRMLIFAPGDKVAVWYPSRKVGRSEKLICKFRGPCTVEEKISDVNYRIKVDKRGTGPKSEVIHVSRLKPYYLRMYD